MLLIIIIIIVVVTTIIVIIYGYKTLQYTIRLEIVRGWQYSINVTAGGGLRTEKVYRIARFIDVYYYAASGVKLAKGSYGTHEDWL